MRTAPTSAFNKRTLSQRLLQRLLQPLSRDKADTLLLLFSCVLVLAPHAEHLPLWTTLISTVLLSWRGWITFRGNRMPARWILLPIAVLTMVGVYATYRTIFGREPGVAMLVLLLTFKMLEMHAKRDLFVVVFLSFFLMLTNFFYSQTIGTALLMIAAVIAILTTQLSFQYTGVVPPLKKRLALGAMIFGLAMPLTLVLFVLFPRIQGPLWGLPGDAQAGRTGLSDNMVPGAISNLAQSGDIAFRVKFIDPAPPKSKLYWRGPVLDNYDGRTWTQSKLNRNRMITVNPHGKPIRHQITLEPTGRRRLFALEHPLSAPQVFDNPSGLTPDLQILTVRPVNERVRYDAASYIDFDVQANESIAVLSQWMQLPAGFNPQTVTYGERLRSQYGSDNAQLINAVLTFFRTEKFSYTLEPPLLGQHAVDEFLFTTRAGFCEHYAGAFVVLMRAAHIPARVVTGYQGGELNTVDDFMTIRQSDAHAWAEVWLQNRGWIRIDPTAAIAPNRIERNLANVVPPTILGGLVTLDGDDNSWIAKLRGSIRQNWDAIGNGWNQWVLNYNPDRQKSFLRSLGFTDPDWRTLTALMITISLLVMVVVVLPLVRNRSKLDPVDALYQALCRSMEKQGLPRMPHEGPRSYGIRLTATESPLPLEKKKAAILFLKLYETMRYATPAAMEQKNTRASAAIMSKLKSLLIACK